MVCWLCIAVFAAVAGAVTTVVLQQLQQRLSTVATEGEVKRISDTDSTAMFELDVAVPAVPGQPAPAVASAPVVVTVLKPQQRVRIDVRNRNHEVVTPAQVMAIQDLVAQACGLTVISRSSEQTHHLVREALDQRDRPADETVDRQNPPQSVQPQLEY